MLTGKESDLKFNSPKCKNCTAKAVSEFTVEYDESVAYFGSNQECIGVLGTLRLDENLGGQINVEVEPLKDVPSVDHGSNREPRGAVRSQTEPCATPTVRFAPQTAPRRHGSVRVGREPPRFATVRRCSPRFAKPPQSTTVFHGSRYFFARFSHPHKHIKSGLHLNLYSRKVFSLTVAL